MTYPRNIKTLLKYQKELEKRIKKAETGELFAGEPFLQINQMRDENNKKLINTPRVAKILKMSRQYIGVLLHEEALPVYTTYKGHRVFCREEIYKFARERMAKQVADARALQKEQKQAQREYAKQVKADAPRQMQIRQQSIAEAQNTRQQRIDTATVEALERAEADPIDEWFERQQIAHPPKT